MLVLLSLLLQQCYFHIAEQWPRTTALIHSSPNHQVTRSGKPICISKTVFSTLPPFSKIHSLITESPAFAPCKNSPTSGERMLMQLLFSLLNIMFILPWERALSLQRDGVPQLPGETHQDPQHPPLSFRGSARFLGWAVARGRSPDPRYSSVHACHCSLISSASVSSLPFLPVIVPTFA